MTMMLFLVVDVRRDLADVSKPLDFIVIKLFVVTCCIRVFDFAILSSLSEFLVASRIILRELSSGYL
jgi:hypothetical protein